MDTLRWSDDPGAYEQHLQRRHNNPLFSVERRLVTQEYINIARARDISDAQALAQQRRALFDAISELDRGQQPWGVFEAIRKEVDAMIERGTGIGGPANQELKALQDLRQVVNASMRKASAVNADLARKLEDAEVFNQSYAEKFLFPFSAQVQRGDSPIPSDELVPSLLMETPETIVNFMQDIDLDFRDRIYYHALILVRKVLDEGVMLERQDDVLAAIKGSK